MKVKYTLVESGKLKEYVDDSFYGVSKALCFRALYDEIEVSDIKVVDDDGNERKVIYDGEKPNYEFTFTYADDGTKAGAYFGSEWSEILYFI